MPRAAAEKMRKVVKMYKVVRRGLVIMAAGLACAAAAQAGTLTVATWNLDGPTGLDDKRLDGFGAFVKNADVVVLEETLGEQQTAEALKRAGLPQWRLAVSDFAKDTLDIYQKQEVAVITRHPIDVTREIDPYPDDDTVQMRAKQFDFDPPAILPMAQRTRKGARGWLWVEIPDLKLVVAAVHLKSSQGATGLKDIDNSYKREAVAAGLGEAIVVDSRMRRDWSYVVAGDFNVAPGDTGKVGPDLNRVCSADNCMGFDQTHALLSSGLIDGLLMRNLTVGLANTYVKGAYAKSPIDNIYAMGPIFDRTTKLTVERGDHFGSDHYAVRVSLEAR